jgi:hypothetical protein
MVCKLDLSAIGTTPSILRTRLPWHDERRFEELPALADALEKAGCTNADLLSHCRQGSEQVRGCWVVDWILGKE